MKTRSAVVSVNTPGVLVSTIPRRVSAGTSTLSYPTAILATILSPGQSSFSRSRSCSRIKGSSSAITARVMSPCRVRRC